MNALEIEINIGDKVEYGIHVLGKWVPSGIGIVISQTSDGSVSGVDRMSLHGGAPWVVQEATNHLRLLPLNHDEGAVKSQPLPDAATTKEVKDITDEEIEDLIL